MRGYVNSLDMPDDFFRVRLVCTMLDFCGGYFDRGSGRKKLDFFLTFFQVVYPHLYPVRKLLKSSYSTTSRPRSAYLWISTSSFKTAML